MAGVVLIMLQPFICGQSFSIRSAWVQSTGYVTDGLLYAPAGT